jgi:hypothetical protein
MIEMSKIDDDLRIASLLMPEVKVEQLGDLHKAAAILNELNERWEGNAAVTITGWEKHGVPQFEVRNGELGAWFNGGWVVADTVSVFVTSDIRVIQCWY